MKDILYASIPDIPDSSLRAILALEFYERAESQVGGLTLSIIAEAAGLSERAMHGALTYLVSHPLDNPIILEYDRDSHILTNPKFMQGKQLPLKKTKRDALGKELKEITLNLVQNSRLGTGRETSILANGEEGVTIARVSQDLGRSLTEGEAYILGKNMSSFGPARVWSAYSRATGKSKIHSMSAMLYQGAMGSKAKERDQKKTVTYRELDV